MKPVFFPFTFMSEGIRRSLRRFFSEIVVLQPTGGDIPEAMRTWEARGDIEIRIASPDDGSIRRRLRAYRSWIRDHRGGDLSIYRYFGDQIPFFDASPVARIKKEIRQADEAQAAAGRPEAGDLLYQARLFLQMAQEFDAQNLDIFRNLEVQAAMERQLFEGLRGGEEDQAAGTIPSAGMPAADEPFGYRVADRLQAWARLMRSLGGGDGLFVTHRRDVVETVMEDFLKAENGIRRQIVKALPLDSNAAELQDALLAHIRNLSQAPIGKIEPGALSEFSTANGDETPVLELFTVADLAPQAFLASLLKETNAAADRPVPGPAVQHTILALVEAAA